MAKKNKDDAARADLDAAVKRQENEQKYLEHLRDALQADANYMDVERDAAAKRARALELELQVAEKHAAIDAGGQDPAKVSDYRALLRQLLEAQKASADRWRDSQPSERKSPSGASGNSSHSRTCDRRTHELTWPLTDPPDSRSPSTTDEGATSSVQS